LGGFDRPDFIERTWMQTCYRRVIFHVLMVRLDNSDNKEAPPGKP
jgi:hypothetical protein